MDIDLKNPLLYQIEVDSKSDCGFVNVEYENVPKFVLHVVPLVTHLFVAS